MTPPGYAIFAVRSATLPPATHTNCVVVGESELWVLDPGSSAADEYAALEASLRQRQARGATVRGIILTHLHHDHIDGANWLRTRLGCQIFAHAKTAEPLVGEITVDSLLEDGAVLPLGHDRRAVVLLTPGHTRGHICLWEEHARVAVVGDLLAGLGSVIINPPEGNVAAYLSSLRRLKALAPQILIPAHGPVIEDAIVKLDQYIAHRLQREASLVKALTKQAATVTELVTRAYADVPDAMRALAGRAVLAHLEKLVDDGVVVASGELEAPLTTFTLVARAH